MSCCAAHAARPSEYPSPRSAARWSTVPISTNDACWRVEIAEFSAAPLVTQVVAHPVTTSVMELLIRPNDSLARSALSGSTAEAISASAVPCDTSSAARRSLASVAAVAQPSIVVAAESVASTTAATDST